MARKIEIQIVGDADSFHKALGKATAGSSKLGHALGGVLRVGAVAGAAGLAAVGFAAARGLDDLMESQRVTAQTGAVLKSTGKAANVTAKQVGNLANRISAYSGIDDEAVQAGENMLLTFTKVQNRVGEGNNIFDRATTTLADMSTALGTDMSKSAIQLGKALNDPVKGVTALTRVGVTFSAGQQKQIAAMVKSGRTADAQKVILRELNKEFGGSAKAAGDTLPGQLHKLSNAFDNAASQVLSGFMPVFLKAAQVVLPALGRIFQVVGRFASQFAQGLSGSGPSSVAQAGWKVHQVFVGQVLPTFRGVVRFVRAYVVPVVVKLKDVFLDSVAAIGKVVAQHGPELHRIFARVGTVIQAVAKVAIPILRFAFVKVLPVAIGIAIDSIDSLTGIIGTVSDKLRAWADRARSVAQRVGGYLGHIAERFKPITDAVRWLLDHLHIDFKVTGLGSGSGLKGGVESTLTGGLSGFRAAGGPVLAGHSYVVGEKGPEILSMGGRGGYVNSTRDSRAIGGGSSDVHVTVLLDGQPIAARVRAEQDKTARRVRGRRGWSA